MLAVTSREEMGSALFERSRFAYPEMDYTAENSHQENCFTEEKTAPRIFLREELETHPEPLPQTSGTYQENSVFFGTIVSGCVVAPNNAAAIAQYSAFRLYMPGQSFAADGTTYMVTDYWGMSDVGPIGQLRDMQSGETLTRAQFEARGAPNPWVAFGFRTLERLGLVFGSAGPASPVFLSARSTGSVAIAADEIAPVETTADGLTHVLERHTYNGITKFLGKSKFNIGENWQKLIRQADNVKPVAQANGRFQRVFDAGRIIGFDHTTGSPTSIVTVITEADGSLVTAFPGNP